MAPANPYLTDDTIQKLAAHNNRLIKRTTVEFYGEPAEEHWDFHRPLESELLGGYLERFAEPDFADGKVTLQSAAQHVYGPDLDDYLVDRVVGMLKPASTFNRTHPVNGLVYVANGNGTISRDDRTFLAQRELDNRLDVAEQRVTRTAHNQARGIDAALKRARRIDPESKAELEARRIERQNTIGRQAQLELGAGE